MNLRMRKTLSWLASAGAIALVAACGGGSATQPPAVKGGTATIRMGGDWVHLDPQHPTATAGIQANLIIGAVYDSLLTLSPDGKIIPYVARSWEQTPNTITFHLRDDATCADGTKVTATVVKNSITRGLKGNSNIANYGPGQRTVTADDATGTVKVDLGVPYTGAIITFATTGGSIICPGGLADTTALQTKPNGSGPYTMVSAVHGDSVVLKLRPEWKWGPMGITAKSSGIPEQIIFKIVVNETTAANLITTGGLDLAPIAGTDIQRLSADKSLVHKQATSYLSYALVFNQAPGHATADPVVRKALTAAIDQKSWNQIAYQGLGKVTPSILTPAADCYEPGTASLLPKNPSPAAARAILTAAGYTAGPNGKLQKDGKPLTVNFVATTVNFGQGPEYLATQWDAAGFTVQANISDFTTYLQRLIAGQFDIFPEQYAGDVPDPNTAVRNFLGANPPAGANWPHTVDPQAEQEWAASNAYTGAERCKHLSNLQKLLLQNADIFPLAAPTSQWYARSGIDFAPASTYLNVRYIHRTK